MKSSFDIVSRILAISSISLTPFLSGCVTKSDYNDLELKYRGAKQELNVKESQIVYERVLTNELKKELEELKERENKANNEKFNFDNVGRLTKENSISVMYYNMLEKGRENEIPGLIEDYPVKVYALIQKGDKEGAREELKRNIRRTSDMLKKLVESDKKYGNKDFHLYPSIKTEAYKQIEESDKILKN